MFKQCLNTNPPWYFGPFFIQIRSEDHYKPDDHYKDIEESWKAIPTEDAIAYPLYDQQLAFYAQNRLEEIAEDALSGEQLFFMAVGFKKPHVNFIFPEDYMQYYPEEVTRNTCIETPFTQLGRGGGAV